MSDAIMLSIESEAGVKYLNLTSCTQKIADFEGNMHRYVEVRCAGVK